MISEMYVIRPVEVIWGLLDPVYGFYGPYLALCKSTLTPPDIPQSREAGFGFGLFCILSRILDSRLMLMQLYCFTLYSEQDLVCIQLQPFQ